MGTLYLGLAISQNKARKIYVRSSGAAGTGGSGGSMNRAPELLGSLRSGATENFLGKTLRKIIKIVATR